MGLLPDAVYSAATVLRTAAAAEVAEDPSDWMKGWIYRPPTLAGNLSATAGYHFAVLYAIILLVTFCFTQNVRV